MVGAIDKVVTDTSSGKVSFYLNQDANQFNSIGVLKENAESSIICCKDYHNNRYNSFSSRFGKTPT
jgi:hypothetical protein